MQFIIFHGSLGSKDGNWFPYLKAKLEGMGQEVICPQYPVDNVDEIKKEESYKTKQNLTSWLRIFEKEVLPRLNKKGKICFIGHSLGNVFILHCLERFKIKLDSVIFVSPCMDTLGLVPWYYDKVNTTFYKTDFDFEALVKLVPVSYVLYSDNDPYIEPRRALHFAKVMNSSTIMVRKAGHLNAEVNMNEFPLVFDLCVTRLDLSLYQKYLYLWGQEQVISILKDPNKKTITLTPEQGYDESRFHFMDLKKSGFATFVSNTEEWDPRAEYYAAGRLAARRGIPLTRIFVVMAKADLNRQVLLEQIELDRKAGIDVRLITVQDLRKITGREDFGIWDVDYVCTINRDVKGNAINVVLDSDVTTLSEAVKASKDLIAKSIKVESAEIIKDFARQI